MDVLDKKKKVRQSRNKKKKIEPHRPPTVPWHRWMAADRAERSTLAAYANKPPDYVPKYNDSNDPYHIIVAKHAYYRDPEGLFIYDLFVASDPRWTTAVNYVRQLAQEYRAEQQNLGTAKNPIQVD